MRTIVIAAVAWLSASAVAAAADLDWRYGRAVHPFPPYFSLHEPWSVQVERPPRKGYWYDMSPIPGAVNALVPMNPEFQYLRPDPWTPAWVAYCSNRWPTFNPKTGTIVTPDGVRMCR